MVSDKQRRAMVRPLIQRRPDLAYHRQYVFCRDLRHYLRGAFFESGSYGAGLTLHAFVWPLFDAAKLFYFRGTFMENRDDRPFEKYYPIEPKKPDFDAAQMAQEISDVIEQQVLPRVADIVSPEALAKRPGYAQAGVDDILGACFNGDFDRAEQLVAAYVAKQGDSLRLWPRDQRDWGKPEKYEPYGIALATEDHKFDGNVRWRMAYLGKLLQADRSRIPPLLHEWEESTVNTFKLNKYWTRTPFPCDR